MVMVSTMFVLRRSMLPGLGPICGVRTNLATRYFFLSWSRFRPGAAIFLQFVMKGLQTDSKNLSGTSLVIAGRFERFQNQHLLCFFDGSAYPKSDSVRIVG